jgi:hypothetical protein
MRKLVFILLFLVIALGAAAGYFYTHSISYKDRAEKAVDQEEAKELALKVSKLMLLPMDEIPVVATVTDPDALKGQAFFLDAKKGYKVLIYTKAKRAVLYDEKSNKIINVAPLNLGDQKTDSGVPAPEGTSQF